MRILFLTNLLPYPLDNGGKIKTYTTLTALSAAGHEIDLLCFTETPDEKNKYEDILLEKCSSIHQVYLRLTTAVNKKYMFKVAIKSLFSRYPFGLLKYKSDDMISEINKLAQTKVYDQIYFDHLQMFIYEKHIKYHWPKTKCIIDEHNCEFMIMQRYAAKTSNIIKKAFLRSEAAKLRRYEGESLQKADKVIVLSKEDDMLLKKIAKNNIQTVIIPIGMIPTDITIKNRKEDLNDVKILFVGTLSWSPNNDGLLWFMKEVFPKMKQRYGKFKLYIVGKNPSDELKKLSERYSNIDIIGYAESVVPYYQKCDFMIIPLFVGSGQRVKIIEGLSFGMPMISTTIGAEGIQYVDGEDLLIADSAEGFYEKAQLMKSGVLRCRLSENARKTFERNYSFGPISERICKVVANLNV